jgi:hypothetical protein
MEPHRFGGYLIAIWKVWILFLADIYLLSLIFPGSLYTLFADR